MEQIRQHLHFLSDQLKLISDQLVMIQTQLPEETVKLRSHHPHQYRREEVVIPQSESWDDDDENTDKRRIVVMLVGTPASLEAAILYLYGKRLKINSRNVAALLEIAEYLIMPGVKAKCVIWISNVKVTDERCLDMIKLASLYEFSLQSYEEYLIGHLPALMHMEAMMDLTEDSVEYIFKDAALLHIKASDKFSFLVRWTARRQQRKWVFEQFLKYIDFADMERSFVTDVVMNEPLIQELDASSQCIAKLNSLETLSSGEILLFPHRYHRDKITCYDMNRRRLCSLKIESEEKRPKRFDNSMIRNIEFVRGKDGSEAYIFEKSDRHRRIYIINFENNSVKQSVVKDIPGHARQDYYPIMCIQDDELILISYHEVEYRKDENDPEEQPALPVEIQDMDMFTSHPLDRDLASPEIDTSIEIRGISQLNVGKIENDKKTRTVPILSLESDVSHVCANKTTIAMLDSQTGLLYIYNREVCSLDAIDLEEEEIYTSSDDIIAEAGESFVIYNDKRLISIEKLIGPSVFNNYLIRVRRWLSEKPEDSYVHKYYFCENRWYHYYQKIYERQKHLVCETTTHAKLMVATQDQVDIPEEIWEDLSVCEPQYRQLSIDPDLKIFQIKVSKERLSCAFNCPHCKLQKASGRRNYRSDDEDDSDDDDDEVFISLSDIDSDSDEYCDSILNYLH